MRAVRDASLLLVGLALLAPAARAEIRGRVRRADTLEPIAGATVHVQAAPQPSATTAADGTFALAVEPAGSVTVTAALPYDRTAAVNFTTAGVSARNGDRAVDLRLEPIPDQPNADYVPIKAAVPGGCGDCHQQHLAEWQGSAHARAAVDEWVLDLYSGTGTPGGSAGYVFRDTHDPGETGFCATCHTPVAEAAAPGTFMLDEVTGTAALEGVTCSACHQIDEVNENVTAMHLLGNATMRFPLAGVDGSATHEYVWGPLDDVSFRFMRAAWQPHFSESRFCASCHEYVNPDTGAPGQTTYSEWLASPSAVPGFGYRTCQDCHMATAGEDGPIAEPPTGEPLIRPAEQRHSHAFDFTTDGGLGPLVTLRLGGFVDSQSVVGVTVEVGNGSRGHSFPTGIAIRNALLVISASADGVPLRQTSGPTVPWWANDDVEGVQEGDYAGQPGTGFAKILAGRINGQGAETMPVLFIDAERVESNTTLAAGETRTLTVTWEMPPAGRPVDIVARVLYRRAFRALAVSKGWTATPDGRPIEREVARGTLRIVPDGGFCAGDCDGDGAVRVDELITAVNIALGSAPLSACAAVNVQEDTVVSIGELIGAVNSALDGCP